MTAERKERFTIELDSENATPVLDHVDRGPVSYRLVKDLMDCTGSGDAEPALRYFLDTYDVEFVTTLRACYPDVQFENADGYERITALPHVLTATATAIYFESETDFTDTDTAKMYLLWQAASDAEEEVR